MSTEAGWTHLGSNGSIPIRPASIAARMSRSERTTAIEYAGVRSSQREHGLTGRAVARVLSPTAARRAGDNGLGDGQRDLLRDASIACLLADAHERRELLIQRVDVLEARVDDLEAKV